MNAANRPRKEESDRAIRMRKIKHLTKYLGHVEEDKTPKNEQGVSGANKPDGITVRSHLWTRGRPGKLSSLLKFRSEDALKISTRAASPGEKHPAIPHGGTQSIKQHAPVQ